MQIFLHSRNIGVFGWVVFVLAEAPNFDMLINDRAVLNLLSADTSRYLVKNERQA
jgi:hypothetical protein